MSKRDADREVVLEDGTRRKSHMGQNGDGGRNHTLATGSVAVTPYRRATAPIGGNALRRSVVRKTNSAHQDLINDRRDPPARLRNPRHRRCKITGRATTSTTTPGGGEARRNSECTAWRWRAHARQRHAPTPRPPRSPARSHAAERTLTEAEIDTINLVPDDLRGRDQLRGATARRGPGHRRRAGGDDSPPTGIRDWARTP